MNLGDTMKNFTNKETNFIESLNEPIHDIDLNLVNSIINKMLQNSEYGELISLLNNLYDFAETPLNIVDELIQDNNKKCISVFLENEESLYFLTDEEKNKLKVFLNVQEINILLDKSYDYYYKMLYDQGIRTWNGNTTKKNNNIIEHIFTRYNKLIKFKLKEIKNVGLVVSCVNYSNYNLSREEQVLKSIDYINKFGFNINRDINNKNML